MIMYEITCRNKQVAYDNPDHVRDTVFNLTNDIEISIDVSNWCEIAAVGEVYTGREFSVEVVER